MQMEGNH